MSRFPKEALDIARGTVDRTRAYVDQIRRQTSAMNLHADALRRSRDEALAKLADYEAVITAAEEAATTVGEIGELLEEVAPGLNADVQSVGVAAREALENYRDAIGKSGWS